MKTAHNFARELLSGPDLQIVVPSLSGTPCEGACDTPTATEEDGEDTEGNAKKILLISGKLTKAGLPRKRAPGAGRKAGQVPVSERRKITGHVIPATWRKIDAVQIEQGCSVGSALDLLLADSERANV